MTHEEFEDEMKNIATVIRCLDYAEGFTGRCVKRSCQSRKKMVKRLLELVNKQHKYCFPEQYKQKEKK